MSFDEPNFDDGGEAPLPEESNNNRTFMIAVGILGGIILISVACIVGIFLFRNRLGGGTQQAQADTNSTATAAAAFISNALTATSQALVSLPTTTSTPVPTSVVKAATITSTVDPAAGGGGAAAGAAGYTRRRNCHCRRSIDPGCGRSTHRCGDHDRPTDYGFADEFGLPGLVVMALAFVIVILLARRLRSAPTLNR